MNPSYVPTLLYLGLCLLVDWAIWPLLEMGLGSAAPRSVKIGIVFLFIGQLYGAAVIWVSQWQIKGGVE